VVDDAPFYVESRWGGSEAAPSAERLRELIDDLNVKDEEHPDTWLSHSSSGWSLRLDESRYAFLDDADCKTVAHMQNVSADQALQLWIRFSSLGPEGVNGEPWTKGPRYISPEETALRQARADASLLQYDREFYDQLGPEHKTELCKSPGCARGHVKYSVLCRIHHFEQICRRPCRFDH
jgi:hypothetical protein